MERKKNTIIRIKDIAEMAGVSVGTVDRIIHDRGEVAAKTRLKVEKVLEEINYSPNLLARSLASKKQYTLSCVIPQHKNHEYWEKIEEGFVLAQQDFAHYNVNIEMHYYNQYDCASFENLSTQLFNSNSDAFVIAPIFKEQTLAFLQNKKVKSLPFSFIDSKIEEVDFLTYYGQNSFQSGFVAAKMLDQTIAEQSTIILIRNKRKGAVSNQTVSRRNGFLHYFIDNPNKNLSIEDLDLHENDDKSNINLLNTTYERYEDIHAIITFNSRVYKIAEYLDQLQFPDVQLVGYDLLEKNINYLKKGTVSFLIDQRPDKQAYYTIRDICTKLIMKQEVKQINYMPIDIIVKENVDSYCQFKE